MDLKKNHNYGYILVEFDHFNIFVWTLPSKTFNAQIRKDSGKKFISSKGKRKLIETDRGREIYSSIFQSFLNIINTEAYSSNSSLGAVFAESFKGNFRNLLKRPVFERGESSWIDVIPTITKQYTY